MTSMMCAGPLSTDVGIVGLTDLLKGTEPKIPRVGEDIGFVHKRELVTIFTPPAVLKGGVVLEMASSIR